MTAAEHQYSILYDVRNTTVEVSLASWWFLPRELEVLQQSKTRFLKAAVLITHGETEQDYKFYETVMQNMQLKLRIFYNEDDCDQARSYFEEEIKFLEEWGSQGAEFHLVGAYRGLAATLRKGGDHARAKETINKSKFYAKRSDNEEGMRIAAIEAARIEDDKSNPDLTKLIVSQPSQHLVARVMTLSTAAEKLLSKDLTDEGKYLLGLALNEAARFQFQHQIDSINKIAKKYKIELRYEWKQG